MTLATFDLAMVRAKKSLFALDLTVDQMQAVMNVMTDVLAVACEELVQASRDAVDAAREAERMKRDE